MRAEDAAEMDACGTNIDTLPGILMQHQMFAFCAFDYASGPISVWGMILKRPGVGAGFAFGTDEWGRALLPMVRQIRGFVLPLLLDMGIHRVEAVALRRRDDVRRFMELIGAWPEGVLQGYGSGGEDFVSYRWLSNEYDHQRSPQPAADAHTSH
jgi:hypothetical protein